jgi:hypothetical protein
MIGFTILGSASSAKSAREFHADLSELAEKKHCTRLGFKTDKHIIKFYFPYLKVPFIGCKSLVF